MKQLKNLLCATRFDCRLFNLLLPALAKHSKGRKRLWVSFQIICYEADESLKPVFPCVGVAGICDPPSLQMFIKEASGRIFNAVELSATNSIRCLVGNFALLRPAPLCGGRQWCPALNDEFRRHAFFRLMGTTLSVFFFTVPQ